MKILVIGAGVVGCVYGWQLSESGNNVTHYVREGKKSELDKTGILIRCLDARGDEKRRIEEIYRPEVIEQTGEEAYDLLIVPVKANQLASVIPVIQAADRNSTILFLQNLWINHMETIENSLPDSRIVYGQPHILGGGKGGNIIDCTIFGDKIAPTMLGKRDGSMPEQLLQIGELMRRARLNPKLSRRMPTWLLTHYAEASGLVAGVMEAGTARDYVAGPQYVRHSVQLIREGFKVCSKLGIHAWRVYPQVLYYSPMCLLLPALLKMYRSEETQLMIQGHITHSPDEMKEMFFDILESGIEKSLPMPLFRQMREYVEDYDQ
jgi:2-dehydropantoate 2-reductase